MVYGQLIGACPNIHSSQKAALLVAAAAGGDSLRPSRSSNDLNSDASSTGNCSGAGGDGGGGGKHQSRRKHSADEIHGSIFNLRKFRREKKKCKQSTTVAAVATVSSVRDAVVTGPQEAVYCPLLLINGRNPPGVDSPIKAAAAAAAASDLSNNNDVSNGSNCGGQQDVSTEILFP